MNIYLPSRDINNTDKNITHGYMGTGSLLYWIMPVRGGMGGPTWYRGVVSGAILFALSDSFFAKTYRFATIQNVTDDRQTDRRHAVPKARPNTVGQKSVYISKVSIQIRVAQFLMDDNVDVYKLAAFLRVAV